MNSAPGKRAELEKKGEKGGGLRNFQGGLKFFREFELFL